LVLIGLAFPGLGLEADGFGSGVLFPNELREVVLLFFNNKSLKIVCGN